ncbi:hypothetical protein GQ600_3959 [Phytophthora cactorum]|nr:hypothetical protein GQ600_3959 [Phytophthora cactorum]
MLNVVQHFPLSKLHSLHDEDQPNPHYLRYS